MAGKYSLYGSRICSKREMRIIGLVTQGFTNREIANKMGTTTDMIKNRLKVIFDKTGMGNRLELALWCVSREGK
jgi:DNA-binding NarL/FixJ family response regulator